MVLPSSESAFTPKLAPQLFAGSALTMTMMSSEVVSFPSLFVSNAAKFTDESVGWIICFVSSAAVFAWARNAASVMLIETSTTPSFTAPPPAVSVSAAGVKLLPERVRAVIARNARERAEEALRHERCVLVHGEFEVGELNIDDEDRTVERTAGRVVERSVRRARMGEVGSGFG